VPVRGGEEHGLRRCLLQRGGLPKWTGEDGASVCTAVNCSIPMRAMRTISATAARGLVGGRARRPVSAAGWARQPIAITSAARRTSRGCRPGGLSIPATGAAVRHKRVLRYKTSVRRKLLK